MRATSAWQISPEGQPQKLLPGAIELEHAFENWIIAEPDLLEPGLRVVARQLQTESGPLDLLCLDDSGRLVVVELKRDSAYRVALAQALDYLCVRRSFISGMVLSLQWY
jgi:RecB family endonuclease NucS